MNPITVFKEKRTEYNSWQSRYKRYKDSDNNKKARNNFQKLMAKTYSELQLSEEQEAILFSQEFYRLTLKNPAGSKFPDFDDYEVTKNGETYCVKGYCDCTNSYGAQVRSDYNYEFYKHNGEWSCITDTGKRYWTWIVLAILILDIPFWISYCSISSM